MPGFFCVSTESYAGTHNTHTRSMWSSVLLYVVVPLVIGMLIGAFGHLWQANGDDEETCPILSSEGGQTDDEHERLLDEDEASSRSSDSTTLRGDAYDEGMEEEWVELTEDDAVTD